MGIDDLFDDDDEGEIDSEDVTDEAEQEEMVFGTVELDEGQESTDCPNCGTESPRAKDPETGELLWYFRCPVDEEECDVTTFVVGSSGGISFDGEEPLGDGESESDGEEGWGDFLDDFVE